MENLTYKPFVRESITQDISIPEPSIDISGYVPRYVDKSSENESSSISGSKYVRAAWGDLTTPKVEEVQEEVIEEPKEDKSKIREANNTAFKSTDAFKSTMLRAYERELENNGLDKSFARALVAQDALESNWGKKPSGKYNFGGIKGKGTDRDTTEYINGKPVRIKDGFRDFDSPEDYARYKIKLLNGKRYRAFSGTVDEFASRVAAGGYATAPTYATDLNRVIRSVKKGGVLKYQWGGYASKDAYMTDDSPEVLRAREWLKNWYKKRDTIMQRNFNDNFFLPIATRALGPALANHYIDTTRVVINPFQLKDNQDGVYRKGSNTIYLRNPDASAAVHEYVHSSVPSAQLRELEKIRKKFGDRIYETGVTPSTYLDNLDEFYSRMMQWRFENNIDPNHEFTRDEVEDMKKGLMEYKIERYLTDNGEKYVVKNLNDEIIESTLDNSDNILDKSSMNVYGDDKFNLGSRYNTDFLLETLNKVADNRKNNKIYAKLGLKL